MSRVPAVPEAEAGVLGRLVYRLARRRFGLVPEPFAIARHHRGLFWAGLLSELAYEKASTALPAPVREIAVYRVATVVGCSWCVDFGTMLQRLEGLDVDRLRRIADFGTDPLFTPQERLAIRYADAMTATPTTVTDELFAELERAFDRAGVLELTQSIAMENLRARANHALGIVDQGFDAACAVRYASGQ
ncbi:carboxymuconolactone decarboxylase family protein [Pseudonocardia pini]|uniref:carboxymuconolactone decarboxylase family protein n=1 Tax=Pseudonocardia pini TaxID=2758030 RepID=UPI0015F121EB|nr:carboxymuconolactone decarboxylase family protein [Pseudonocardia pini]